MCKKTFTTVAALALIFSGAAWAGPMDNARQFQEKALKTTARNTDKPYKSTDNLIRINKDEPVKKPQDKKAADVQPKEKSTAK